MSPVLDSITDNSGKQLDHGRPERQAVAAPSVGAASAAVKLFRWGGDGYAYGLLASGHVDLVVEAGLKLYDFAALAPVIKGAGGLITDWQGKELDMQSDGSALAAGDPAVHRAAARILS